MEGLAAEGQDDHPVPPVRATHEHQTPRRTPGKVGILAQRHSASKTLEAFFQTGSFPMLVIFGFVLSVDRHEGGLPVAVSLHPALAVGCGIAGRVRTGYMPHTSLAFDLCRVC